MYKGLEVSMRYLPTIKVGKISTPVTSNLGYLIDLHPRLRHILSSRVDEAGRRKSNFRQDVHEISGDTLIFLD